MTHPHHGGLPPSPESASVGPSSTGPLHATGLGDALPTGGTSASFAKTDPGNNASIADDPVASGAETSPEESGSPADPHGAAGSNVFRQQARAERLIATVAAILTVAGCWPAYQLGLAEGGTPTAGMIPLLVFAGAAVQATYLAVRPPRDVTANPPAGPSTCTDTTETDSPASEKRVDAERTDGKGQGGEEYNAEWKRPLLAAAAVAGYLLALPTLGYLLTTATFSVALLFLAGFPLRRIAPAAVLLTAVCYLLFQVLLQVPFPTLLGV